jgi:hypothetical protein
MRLSTLLIGASVLLLPGCGGGGGGGGNSGGGGQIGSAQVSPPTAYLPPSGNQQFSAAIPNVVIPTISWSVQEGAAGGSVTQTGDYMAPPLAGTYHVVATAHGNSNAVGIATVTVHLTVSVSPVTTNTTLNKPAQFIATVAGSPNTAVSWKVVEGAVGGSISATGLYMPVAAGTYHVTATSAADPTQSSTATVNVQVGNATGTIQ